MFSNETAIIDISEYAHQKSAQAIDVNDLSGKNQRGTYWQSIRSVIPPWPGMECPKSLMSKARLNPEAKNPPKGATRDAKQDMKSRCHWYGAYVIVVTDRRNYVTLY